MIISFKHRNSFVSITVAICFLIIAGLLPALAQGDSTTLNAKRLAIVSGAGAAVYVGGMAGLYSLWYADYPQSDFHFFNDNNEWLQMDKMGHTFSAYYIGKLGHQSLTWSGLNNKKATWYAAGYSLLFMTTIEVFDGFSEEWGFSKGDFIANVSGAGLFTAQQLIWQEQRIGLRFSYHATSYPQYRPDVLGSTPVERLFKDYNGQTYWLSANIHAFLNNESKFPKWLNFAVGYGADGMTGGTSNPDSANGLAIPSFERSRQFYLSPDIDLSKIKTRSKFFNSVFGFVGFLKVPLPTVEFNQKGKVNFYWFYF